MARKNPFKFGTDLWDPSNRFETSWLISLWLLFICRAIIALYAFVTRFFIIGWTCAHDSLGGCSDVRQSFSYFTILTYWGLAFYFLVAAIHTLTYAIRGRSLLDRFPRPLQALYSFFYTTIVTFPFLVTIVYWGVLYKSWFTVEFTAWENISQHALNSLFALFEIFIPRTSPMLWVHILWLILILAGYLAVAYITLADQGWYTYNFLDHDKVGGRGIVAAYIIGIAVGIVIIFCIVYGVVWVRKWVTETKLGKDGKFAKQPRNHDTEMNAVGNKYAIGSHSETPDRAYVG
ncbi:Fc.00g022470.m01.CDS01 [Cosmosporella sp. VM-42]